MKLPSSTSAIERRFLWHLVSVIALVLLGTSGFMLIEHWRFLDALYMTVTTLTTVGYGEVHPLSDAGRIYDIVLILTGVGVILYILSDMVEIFLEANPTALLGRRRMKEQIAQLSGHQIVCGFGRTGQEVAHHFSQNRVLFVVIEADPVRAKQAVESGFLVLKGDATDDSILSQAQISKASGIVCALADDTANTFIALSARGMKESITIVSRAANPGSEAKMRLAGAHMVISPYVIGGRRMATAVTHPLVMEFLDVVMHTPGYDLRLEQIRVGSESTLSGLSLRDSKIKQLAGAMVVAVRQNGKLITNPPLDLAFCEGDELIALGSDEELKNLSKMAAPRN